MRGYIRERRAGPSVADQREALAAAGVRTTGSQPPIYIDRIPERTHKALDNPLPARTAALRSLRRGDHDVLVVYDPATLGQTQGDILDALAAIGEHGSTLIVCHPPGEYRPHPDLAKCLGLAVDGQTMLDRERRRVRTESAPLIGRPKKLTGAALSLARDLWGQREMSSKMVAAALLEQTGVKVGVRTLLHHLGHKTDAVEAREQISRRPGPAQVAKRKRKA